MQHDLLKPSRSFRTSSLAFLAALLIFSVATVCIQLESPTEAAYNGYTIDRYNSPITYGIGVYFCPYLTTIYSEPKESASVVRSIQWSAQTDPRGVFDPSTQQFYSAASLFMAFYPNLSIAAMAMVSENGEGWAEVVYDQRSGKTGWVKLAQSETSESTTGEKPVSATPENPVHLGRFQTWLDFMKYNGRATGIYWLSGVKDYHKQMRMQPNDESKFVPIQVMRDIRVKHVRGNWMLIEATDIMRQHPMGWVRWRDSEGRLMIFPNLAGRNTPFVIGTF